MESPAETMFWRQLFTDAESLKAYLSGEAPEAKAIARQAFIAERRLGPRLPDHYYKNLMAGGMGRAETIKDLLLDGLKALAEHFLRPAGDLLVVEGDRFEQWQRHLPGLSPLVIVSYGIYARHDGPGTTDVERSAYLDTFIRPQLGRSALPTVDDPELDGLVRAKGLHDLHIHLNGTTEVDAVWLDALRDPGHFREAMGLKPDQVPRAEVLEQFTQVEPGLSLDELCWRLGRARALRWSLAEVVLLGQRLPCQANELACRADGTFDTMTAGWPMHLHPVEHLCTGVPEANDLCREALLLIAAFHRLKQGFQDIAPTLHAYLLSQGCFARLCVQQLDQVGLQQFQKLSWNRLRWRVETEYARRFEQIAFSAEGDLALVEGRFAPKGKVDDLTQDLTAILRGYDAYRDALAEDDRGLELRLVAHFIKEDELPTQVLKANFPFRFHEARKRYDSQVRGLVAMCKASSRLASCLTGIDAAAGELYMPPEVFAPVFRACRDAGFARFTYHVGEDFEHLLSGIRAVHDALVYLRLAKGDRIGHGTAIGIDPARWIARYPATVLRRRGDWLDDLLFAYHHLEGWAPGAAIRADLLAPIAIHSAVLYGAAVSPDDLIRAASLRDLDPQIACDPNYRRANNIQPFAVQEQTDVDNAVRWNPRAYDLFRRYHDQAVAKRGLELIPAPTDQLDEPALRYLQERVLNLVIARGVVLEALPTSNVLITGYGSYAEHHLLRWLAPRSQGDGPRVCLGTDDPGIFATNLRNEFAHMFRELRTTFPAEAPGIVERLLATGAGAGFPLRSSGPNLFAAGEHGVMEAP